jgi:hypothetical protein
VAPPVAGQSSTTVTTPAPTLTPPSTDSRDCCAVSRLGPAATEARSAAQARLTGARRRDAFVNDSRTPAVRGIDGQRRALEPLRVYADGDRFKAAVNLTDAQGVGSLSFSLWPDPGLNISNACRPTSGLYRYCETRIGPHGEFITIATMPTSSGGSATTLGVNIAKPDGTLIVVWCVNAPTDSGDDTVEYDAQRPTPPLTADQTSGRGRSRLTLYPRRWRCAECSRRAPRAVSQ